MGCFSASKVEKQRAASAPRSGSLKRVIASKDALTLLSNKPVELPDPGKIINLRSENNHHWNGAAAPAARSSRFSDEPTPPHPKARTEFLKQGRKAFSGPLLHEKTASRLLPSYESSHERSSSCGLRTLRRTTSFGGRPQPLPPPALVHAKRDDVGRQVRSFTLDDSPGSWTARRGRVAPVGGVPLPPPSLAGRMLTSVTAFESADLVGDSGAARGAFGDVHRSRVSGNSSGRMDATVFRLPGKVASAL